jgi:uncharacterized protein YeaO (DUF488 family)
MPIRIVKLGSPREKDEGTRIGTVRRPPRGVPKAEFSTGNWYDTWLPPLAPSQETVKLGQEATNPAEWATFVKKYKAEIGAPAAEQCLNLLAVLSHSADFSVGCYCEHESKCHRSVLRELLLARGASVK